jgi:hypothetical protein
MLALLIFREATPFNRAGLWILDEKMTALIILIQNAKLMPKFELQRSSSNMN